MGKSEPNLRPFVPSLFYTMKYIAAKRVARFIGKE